MHAKYNLHLTLLHFFLCFYCSDLVRKHFFSWGEENEKFFSRSGVIKYLWSLVLIAWHFPSTFCLKSWNFFPWGIMQANLVWVEKKLSRQPHKKSWQINSDEETEIAFLRRNKLTCLSFHCNWITRGLDCH